MRPSVASLASVVLLAVATALAGCGGVKLAQSRPPPRKPVTDIAREERGQIVTVRDTQLDLSTGRGRAIGASAPAIPVGPVGIRVPVTIGGEKRVDVPAEEITVRLANGKLIAIVQELSSPPMAPGERVRVLHERTDDGSGPGRIQIVRVQP